MKRIIYLLSAMLSLGFMACDDYVDLTPTGQKTVDSAYTYYELVALPNRTYNPMALAMLSDNVWIMENKVIGYENLTFDGINTTFNEAAHRLSLSDNNLYANCYDYILRSNIVISNIDASSGTTAIKQLAKAEARVMRAWDHFILVNTYAKAYDPATASTDGGVAIVDAYDLEATPAKATVEQVYQFIIDDLEASLPLLQDTTASPYHPSKAFAYALAAKVYLFHRDYSKALDAAKASLALKNDLIDYVALAAAGGPTKATTYAKGNNPEVLNYAYQGGPSDNPIYYYGMLSPEMVVLYGTQDERYNKFFKTTGNSPYNFDQGSGAALWNASITYSNFQYMSVGLRTAEVYLMKAEAEARLGNLAAATATLNTLRATRIQPAGATLATANTVQEAMHRVIDERRRELLFGFNRFWDLKRFNTETDYQKTLTRTFPVVTTTVPQHTYTLRPGSRLYIIPFPQEAREKNPNLTLNTDE